MGDTALRLIGISKVFGRFKALDNLSLEVREGEILTLLGPSGCGKTTTLRILAGLEEPDDGELYFRDRLLVSPRRGVFVPPHKRDLGMVFQSYAIWPHMTVFDNVAYPLRVRGVRGREVRERVMRALDSVGLQGLENRHGPNLSGGQQQRVALARALVYEPSVLLMDEPFSNLDAKLREQMRVLIRVLLKRLGITTVFVTHDQVEALSLSDRVVLMNGGRIEQLGTPRELYERPATSFARDFVGRTILLEGTCEQVDERQGASVKLRCLPEHRLVATPGDRSDLTAGCRVSVAIRPEEVQLRRGGLSDGGRAPNELPGTVEALLFVGEHQECRVRLGDGESVLLHTPHSLSLQEGESVCLVVEPEGVSLWPA